MSGSDPQPGRLRLATIGFGTPFLATLARHVIDSFGTGPELARVQLILPSARARRALVEAFLAAAGTTAMLLPRVTAVAQVDEEETLGRLLEEGGEQPLAPAIAPLARRIALARLLLGTGTGAGSAAGAERLAGDLARVLDLLTANGVPPARLAELDSSALAAHRGKRLAILSAIVTHWPGLLDERALNDPVARREALLAALATRWERAPPGPVIAAGFAAAPPAVARLLGVIARLPQGRVVLPGLDPSISDEEWQAIGTAPTHPLHGLFGLLEAMGATPGDARLLGAAGHLRAGALLAAFRPAGTPPAPRAPVPSGLRAIELPGANAEALAIALAMRRTLEAPGRTAALVTRSRPLARRVAAALARWGIDVDDSAGEPLALRPAGAFLLALLAAATTRFRPVALLAVLKHPLAAAQTPATRAPWLSSVRALDLALRGPVPEPGLAGIRARLVQRPTHALLGWWDTEAAPPLAALEVLFAGQPSLAEVGAALTEAGAALAGDRLWAGPDGRALAELMAALAASPDAGRLPLPRDEADALLHALLSDVPVRPPWRRHPRLAILGPLEARLAHADLLILGDMNEGSWPAPPGPDPWLPPAVRRTLGLPPAEARIGLEAHDLLSAAAADDILLTRARRGPDGPTVRSRFLLRLEAAFGALPGDEVADLAARLDGALRTVRIEAPAPAPPPAERPRRLRVTEADMLAADPFAFYARRMLGLSPLDPLEQEADAAMRGTVVHRILQRMVAEAPADTVRLVDEELGKLGGDPALLRLWAPRVRRMVAWVREQLTEERKAGWTGVQAEVKLACEWAGVRIEGRADRIDVNGEGGLRLVDYKTGSLPKKKDISAGHHRQLPLMRLLVEQGGAPLAGTVAELAYWKPSGGRLESEVRKVDLDRAALEADMRQLFARFLFGDAPFRAKLIPVFATAYRSFDQLARVEEWL